MLAYAGKSWQEHDAGEIERLMHLEPADQPIGFMGPPVLIDTQSGLALSQMPSIAIYLGDSLGLIANEPGLRAKTAKVVNDANDVIDELTLDGGRQMWTEAKWEQFLPRLRKWMAIWEATAARHGMTDDGGHLLGTTQAGVADIVTSTLWSTMGDRFSSIQAMLEATAPRTAAMTRRMQATPSLAALQARSFEQYGQAYCGGEIEKSLRRVLGRAS
nr:glutathione S-transferase [Ancylobacter defluvii]